MSLCLSGGALDLVGYGPGVARAGVPLRLELRFARRDRPASKLRFERELPAPAPGRLELEVEVVRGREVLWAGKVWFDVIP